MNNSSVNVFEELGKAFYFGSFDMPEAFAKVNEDTVERPIRDDYCLWDTWGDEFLDAPIGNEHIARKGEAVRRRTLNRHHKAFERMHHVGPVSQEDQQELEKLGTSAEQIVDMNMAQLRELSHKAINQASFAIWRARGSTALEMCQERRSWRLYNKFSSENGFGYQRPKTSDLHREILQQLEDEAEDFLPPFYQYDGTDYSGDFIDGVTNAPEDFEWEDDWGNITGWDSVDEDYLAGYWDFDFLQEDPIDLTEILYRFDERLQLWCPTEHSPLWVRLMRARPLIEKEKYTFFKNRVEAHDGEAQLAMQDDTIYIFLHALTLD